MVPERQMMLHAGAHSRLSFRGGLSRMCAFTPSAYTSKMAFRVGVHGAVFLLGQPAEPDCPQVQVGARRALSEPPKTSEILPAPILQKSIRQNPSSAVTYPCAKNRLCMVVARCGEPSSSRKTCTSAVRPVAVTVRLSVGTRRALSSGGPER